MKPFLWFVIVVVASIAAAHAQAPAVPGIATLEAAAIDRGPKAITVNFAIKPWGDVLVDGKPYGISPPLKSLHLTAGKHTITIKNSTYPSRVESIDLKQGEQLMIRHAFTDEKPSTAAASKGN